MNATHAQFHRNAAESARRSARQYYELAGYDRSSPIYQKGAVFDRLANQHVLAANGTASFDDCPDCTNLRHQEH